MKSRASKVCVGCGFFQKRGTTRITDAQLRTSPAPTVALSGSMTILKEQKMQSFATLVKLVPACHACCSSALHVASDTRDASALACACAVHRAPRNAAMTGLGKTSAYDEVRTIQWASGRRHSALPSSPEPGRGESCRLQQACSVEHEQPCFGTSMI